MAQFTDAFGRTIQDGAKVKFSGNFPEKMPTEKCIRRGIVQIIGGRLVLYVYTGGKWRASGLYWELDGEPCYDLVLDNE